MRSFFGIVLTVFLQLSSFPFPGQSPKPLSGESDNALFSNSLSNKNPVDTSPHPGDLDDNGVVNAEDLALLEDFLADNITGGQVPVVANADVNGDGAVDARDTNVLMRKVTSGYSAGDLYAIDSIVGNLRFVPAGIFMQGSPEDEPCREPWGGSETQFTR